MNEFDNWLTRNNIQRPVILWLDMHSTRLNYWFLQEAKDRGIIVYGLVPNGTDKIQPLDLTVFGNVKGEYLEKYYSLCSSEIFTFLSDRPLYRGWGRHVKLLYPGQLIVDSH